MTEDAVYRKLARKLDAIPNGFPATASGIEFKLLAKIFAPEEAAVAAAMGSAREPAETIAHRLDRDPKDTRRLLKAMTRKGLIHAGRKDGKLAFGLMPFVVGFYEEQLPRMDTELAQLFEAYFVEVRGALGQYAPAVHRVLPVEEAVSADIEIYPYERATELLESAKSWGVRDCICRVQQKLVGKGCDRPVENCLVFAPVEGAFEHSETSRAITKEEALVILHDAEEQGLVHSPGNFQDGHFYICNCCTCCCGVLRSVAEYSVPTAIARADFVVRVDADLCAGCGDCLERCQFGALTVQSGQCAVDEGSCVGCGLCVTICPTEALVLTRRRRGSVPPTPVSYRDWLAQRAESRGLELDR